MLSLTDAEAGKPGGITLGSVDNEPVAWTSQDVLDADHIIKAVVRREQDEQHTIPLYTHPAKTLTDRIAELERELKRTKFAWNLAENELEALKAKTPTLVLDGNRVYPAFKTLTDEEIYQLAEYHGINDWLYETSVTDFAKAILKKASEK